MRYKERAESDCEADEAGEQQAGEDELHFLRKLVQEDQHHQKRLQQFVGDFAVHQPKLRAVTAHKPTPEFRSINLRSLSGLLVPLQQQHDVHFG